MGHLGERHRRCITYRLATPTLGKPDQAMVRQPPAPRCWAGPQHLRADCPRGADRGRRECRSARSRARPPVRRLKVRPNDRRSLGDSGHATSAWSTSTRCSPRHVFALQMRPTAASTTTRPSTTYARYAHMRSILRHPTISRDLQGLCHVGHQRSPHRAFAAPPLPG
jgi:hypothetical protein